MLVANSFDLWQKDTFFSAAEEVQQSADIMESAYRTWLSARREGLTSQHLDGLGRELQMALGTAKWQLEEFERAVRMSHRSHGDDATISRHRQFVSAMEDQISTVATALKESFDVEGKKPFRWVHLDEEECDELAFFLSGISGTSQQTTDEDLIPGAVDTGSLGENKNVKEDSNLSSGVCSRIHMPNKGKSLEEVGPRNEDASCFIELKESRSLQTVAEISYDTDRIASNRRPCNSSDRCSLEIVIDRDDRQQNALIEATPKEKGSKTSFWSSRGEDQSGAKGVSNQLKINNWINQCLRGHRNQRQQQVSPVFPVNSIRYILTLMLAVFLVVPFLVYST